MSVFFNSVIQVLYSVDTFREFVSQIKTDASSSPAQVALKQLFVSITFSDSPFETYALIPSFEFLGYEHSLYQQYDAQECLIQILDSFFPIGNDEESFFKTSIMESILCKNCKKVSEKTVYDPTCHIKFSNNLNNSIAREISKLVEDPFGEPLDELYQCTNCPIRTNATNSRTLFHVSDYLIVSLGMFQFDKTTGNSRKKVPDLTIEKKIENILLGTLTLQAVIFHHGDTANSGHYTSAVKNNNMWYLINDDKVTRVNNVNFDCRINDSTVPYLLIYKKINLPALVSDESCLFSQPDHKNSEKKSVFTDINPIKNIPPNKSKVMLKDRVDKILEEECNLYDVIFLPPSEDESITLKRKRRKTMRNDIKLKKNCIDSIDVHPQKVDFKIFKGINYSSSSSIQTNCKGCEESKLHLPETTDIKINFPIKFHDKADPGILKPEKTIRFEPYQTKRPNVENGKHSQLDSVLNKIFKKPQSKNNNEKFDTGLNSIFKPKSPPKSQIANSFKNNQTPGIFEIKNDLTRTNQTDILQASSSPSPVKETVNNSVEGSFPCQHTHEDLNIHENELVKQAVSKFIEGEKRHTVGICITCQEIRPVFFSFLPKKKNEDPWGIKEQRCPRCYTEYSKKQKYNLNHALTFSGFLSPKIDWLIDEAGMPLHNNQNFINVPPFLLGLTFVETLLIRKISIAIYVHCLKYGMLASKGHAVAIPSNLRIFTKLPQLPSEIGILLIRSGNNNSKAYMASRKRVQDALNGLVFGNPLFGLDSPKAGYSLYQGKNHISGRVLKGKYFLHEPNPYYYDVTIEQDRLHKIPEHYGIVEGLPIVSAHKDAESSEEDRGPAPGQFEKLAVDEELTTSSGFATQLKTSDADENVKNALRLFLGEHSNVEELIEAGGVADMGKLHSNNKRDKPIPELSTEGFFTMCYPHIFVNGSCDITIKKAKNLNFQDWIDHIYYCKDNRVPAHRFLKFHLMNINMRQKALGQGSFCVNQQINEKQLSRDELLEKLRNEDETIPRKFLSMSANLIDTAPYWRERKNELDSFCFFMLKEHNVYPTYFDTSSCAEHHFVPLHNVLIKYLSITNGESEDVIREKFHADSKFRHQAILQNQHIVTSYFDVRHNNYKDTVLKELFQYEEHWSRYEFAKSRGQIHSHSLYFSKSHYDIVKSILSQDCSDPSVDIAKDLERWFQTNEMNEDGIFSPNFVSMHPAGGEAQHYTDKPPQWMPNKEQWPLPEGTLTNVDSDVLKKCLLCQRSPEDLKNFQMNLVNKVMLHSCSSYCLRRKTVKTKEKDQDGQRVEEVVRYCRHHFGNYDNKTKTSAGKETNPFAPRLTKGEIQRYEGKNDHPRMVQHIFLRPLTWQAQCDTQPIVTEDLLALIKYITGYCCKGNTSTKEMMSIYREILNKSDPSISLRSVAQKLILKTVSQVDTPSAAADYINTKGKLYSCSRRFNSIGLSGFRVFDPKAKDVTKKNPLDRFLSDTRRQEDPNITLFDWAKKCTCAKKNPCGKDHVPVFTGCQRFWVWPTGEDFSKELLMKFSPGTWRKIEDLKNGYETYTESFANFIDTENCPESVKMMLKFAKIDYDKKLAKKWRQNPPNNVPPQEINFSQSTASSQDSQDSQASQDSVFDTMGNQLLRDFARENRASIEEAPVDEEVMYSGGDDFDWHSNGLRWLGVQSFSEQHMEETKEWLSDVSKQAAQAHEREGRLCTLPEVDPKIVNHIQMLIVFYNIKTLLEYARGNSNVGYENCKRLIVQGCAGTGKSQVVKIITRLVRRIFKCNRAVLNVAPTSAAGLLLPDGGTIHSCVNIPRKTKDKISLEDRPMSAAQSEHLKSLALDKETKQLSLMCINADERGMVGQYVLAWFHRRFVELSENLLDAESDVPFGCIPIFNFFGDIFQLRAIGEHNLYDDIFDSTDKIDIAGGTVYKNFVDVFILEEIMRQQPGQAALLRRLDNLRIGRVTRNDWEEINQRCYDNLPSEEKVKFDDETSDVICLTETWKEASKYNRSVLNSKIFHGERVVCAEFKSNGYGKHHNTAKESLSQIPNRTVIAVGCRVILTKNQGCMTRLGLNNGAIGTVITILYKPNVKPPHLPEIVVVDFPRYKGPAWDAQHPTWVPITANVVTCEDVAKCCRRTGFPLITGYAITIAKSQGMTIGPNQQVTNVIIKLSPETGMEQRNCGTSYTAFSRVTQDEDWCLAEPIPFERLEYINRNPQLKLRKKEEERLRILSEKTVAENLCSTEEYLKLLREVDSFCDDGVEDASCTNLGCSKCLIHK